MVKPQIKQFYVYQGVEQSKLKRGLMTYFENKLRNAYEKANNDNIVDIEKIKDLKSRIETHRKKSNKCLKS